MDNKCWKCGEAPIYMMGPGKSFCANHAPVNGWHAPDAAAAMPAGAGGFTYYVSTNPPQLWEITFRSSYWDSDPRGSSRIEVGKNFYIMAASHAEAILKAEPLLDPLKKEYEKEKYEIEANPFAIENLVVARKVKGAYSESLVKIELALEDDKKNYSLQPSLYRFNFGQQ